MGQASLEKKMVEPQSTDKKKTERWGDQTTNPLSAENMREQTPPQVKKPPPEGTKDSSQQPKREEAVAKIN